MAASYISQSLAMVSFPGQTAVYGRVCVCDRAKFWSHSQARQLYMVEYVYVTEPSSGLIPRPDSCIW